MSTLKKYMYCIYLTVLHNVKFKKMFICLAVLHNIKSKPVEMFSSTA